MCTLMHPRTLRCIPMHPSTRTPIRHPTRTHPHRPTGRQWMDQREVPESESESKGGTSNDSL